MFSSTIHRYFVVGLDAKVQRGVARRYVTYIVLATSNELILVDVVTLQRTPTFKMFDLLALAKLLSDPNITKVFNVLLISYDNPSSNLHFDFALIEDLC